MSMDIPSSATAVGAIARVSFRRALRAMLLVSVLCAFLPALFALLSRQSHNLVSDGFTMETLLLGIVAPLIVGWPIGDEIDDRTATYLWSRPLARWTILAGKLTALVPIVFAVFAVGWLAFGGAAGGAPFEPLGFVALVLGSIVCSSAAAGLALLLPKHPLILSLIVLAVVDQTLGAMPASIRQITISHQAQVLAGVADGDALGAAIALVVISAFWLWLGLWRVRRIQL